MRHHRSADTAGLAERQAIENAGHRRQQRETPVGKRSGTADGPRRTAAKSRSGRPIRCAASRSSTAAAARERRTPRPAPEPTARRKNQHDDHGSPDPGGSGGWNLPHPIHQASAATTGSMSRKKSAPIFHSRSRGPESEADSLHAADAQQREGAGADPHGLSQDFERQPGIGTDVQGRRKPWPEPRPPSARAAAGPTAGFCGSTTYQKDTSPASSAIPASDCQRNDPNASEAAQ